MLMRAYRVLHAVYRNGAFVGQALTAALADDPTAAAELTKTVYGVLERDATLEWYLKALCARPPKPDAAVLAKLGLWRRLFSDAPSYAAVNETAELAHRLHRDGLAGFLNAVLRKAPDVAPPTDPRERLSFDSGKPLWFVDAVTADYGDRARSILLARPTTLTHVRGLSGIGVPTPFGAFVTGEERKRVDETKFCVQSVGSCAVAAAVGARDGERILDACAAPGGKAAAIAESADCSVLACELHPHRVDLLRAYVARRGIRNVTAEQADATVFDAQKAEAFDRVLADVPCSGTGVVWSKPDILLKKPDLAALARTQTAILQNVARYVRRGGMLVYATCSLLACENDAVVGAFLARNPVFAPEAVETPLAALPTRFGTQILPSEQSEGFYVAKLGRRA